VIPLLHQSVAPGTGDCDRCRCQGEGGPAPAAGAEQGSSSTPPPSTARTGTWLGLDDDEPKASSFRLVLLGYTDVDSRLIYRCDAESVGPIDCFATEFD